MNFNEKQLKILKKKGIETDKDLAYFFPKKYTNYVPIDRIGIITTKTSVYCAGTLLKVKNHPKFISATISLCNGTIIYVNWFNQMYILRTIQNWVNKTVYICGDIECNKYCNLQINNPVVFSLFQTDAYLYRPVYTNLKGIGIDNLRSNIYNSIMNLEDKVLPDGIMQKYNLVSRKEALLKMHFPLNGMDVYIAQQYLVIELLFLFSKEFANIHLSQKNDYKINQYERTKKVINNLPYRLTPSQEQISIKLIENMTKEERVSALVQGDVGCGKTTIAQYTALAMAENGHQIALIAPTTVLAEQHYKKFIELVKDDTDVFKPLLFNGGLTVKQKNEVFRKIKEKEVNIIIGTTAILNAEFNSLGLIIVDEEHRFGVSQKELLSKETENGVNTITMSATPIPRSLAIVLYAGTSEVLQVTDLPQGRKPVATSIIDHSALIVKDIEEARKRGEKVYIICPKIDDSNANERISVEAAEKKYKGLLSNSDKICTVTGKMKTEEIQKKIQEFRDGIYDVLISTTVVEVGVDVPDATIIVIEDADMFGLSQLHQLRGRVGRSSLQSCCYLIPRNGVKEKGLERLKILCDSNDGFVISEADLKERGPGDILGERQSGKDSDLLLALKYPNTFNDLRSYHNQTPS